MLPHVQSGVAWGKLRETDQRIVRKLAYFASRFSVDAAFSYAKLDVRTLERILDAGVLRSESAGFVLDPRLREIVAALPVAARKRNAEAKAFGEWLLSTGERVMASA